MKDTALPPDFHERLQRLASTYDVAISHGSVDEGNLVHIPVRAAHPLYIRTEHPAWESRLTEEGAKAMRNIVKAAEALSVGAHQVVLSFPESRTWALRDIRGIAERDEKTLVIMFVMANSNFKKSARRTLRRMLGSSRPAIGPSQRMPSSASQPDEGEP